MDILNEERFEKGGVVLERLHPELAVEPFMPYYERMGYEVKTNVLPNGWTEIIGEKINKPDSDIVEYLQNHTKDEAYRLNNSNWNSRFISNAQYNVNRDYITNFAKGGRLRSIMKDIHNYNAPFSVVAVDTDNRKVLEQAISIQDWQLIPAHYRVLKEKYPNATIRVEDGTGISLFAKGGRTTHSRRVDARRLSKEPWEQAYLPNRKGSYYAKGGEIKVGDTIIPYPYNKELIIDKVFKNKDNELSYRGKFKGENKTYEFILGSKDKYTKGGITEINEDGSNIPPELMAVFDDNFDEDRLGDYIYMEELKDKAREIGYDFDYDLSGSPTEFWKVTPESFAKGGRVKIVNEGKDYNENMYKGIFDDDDKDGIPNADDLNPKDPKKSIQIEQVRFTDTFKKLLKDKKEYDKSMNDIVGRLEKDLPTKFNIYARTKTPFSIIKKLVEKRIKGEKGLYDMIGTTITVDNNKDISDVEHLIDSGIYGEVIEKDDYFVNPKAGYMAKHYIVNYNGTPIEIQLKTKLMKELNEFSHDFYKAGTLDAKGMGEVASMIAQADNGDNKMRKEAIDLLADKNKLKEIISTEKFADGGSVEWFDYSNSDLEKLPYDLDRYFIKNENTKEYPISSLTPTRARKKGVHNANKYMKMAYNGEMDRRKPISVYEKDGKLYVFDGNSTFANAKYSGWKTIYADIVENPDNIFKEADENIKIIK